MRFTKFNTIVYVNFYKKINENEYCYYKTETVTSSGNTISASESAAILKATCLFPTVKDKLLYGLVTKKIK
jgi:hypothetical protein